MKTVNIYLRKTDASAIIVDSSNRPANSIAAIHRNEPLTLNIHVFDGTASTQMTQAQLAAFAATWNLNIAPSPNMEGPLCLQSTSATVGADGTISIIVDVTDTVQAAAEIGNDTRAIWAAELTGTPGNSEQPNLILQWRIAYINRVASENEPPPTAETNNYYPKPVVDAKFADIDSTLHIPRDVADLTDNDRLLFDGDYNSLQNLPTIPPDLTDELAGKVDKVTGYGLSKNDYTDAAVAKVAKIDLETLTELTGADVTVAPWTQSKWSASGVCSLTATGWAESGVQTSEILITLAAGSTPSVIGAAVSDNDVLSAAGVYSCFIRNEDGVVRFKIAGFTEAV